jgi:hypothetical protein
MLSTVIYLSRHYIHSNKVRLLVIEAITRPVVSVSALTWGLFYYRNLQLLNTSIALRVPLVEQELLTIQEHLSSPSVFSGVRVTRSLVFCVRFCRSLFAPLSSFF